MAIAQQQLDPDMSWLIKAARQLLRPVARLLVGKLSCQIAIELLKAAYVEEARSQLMRENPDQRVTKSLLSLLTGLDTRVVSAVEAENSYTAVRAKDLCPEADILHAWCQQQTYQDPETGKPAILPITGRGVSFQTLVSRTAGRNVTYATVLRRLTESGNLEEVDEDHVRIISPHYNAIDASEQTVIEIGSASIDRLGRTVMHNLKAKPPAPKWLHQDRWTRYIPADQVDTLRTRIRSLLTEDISNVEAELDRCETPLRKEGCTTVGVGWFYWEDPDEHCGITESR